MKTFNVYKHPTQGYEAVKQGFSWPGFFFTAIWAFVKKMWGPGLVILGVFVLLVFAETVFEQEGSQGGVTIMLLFQFGLYIMVGMKGNDWRRENLVKRGFEKLNTLDAETPDAAIGSTASISTEQNRSEN
jgi:uncharacterized protein DUF2628